MRLADTALLLCLAVSALAACNDQGPGNVAGGQDADTVEQLDGASGAASGVGTAEDLEARVVPQRPTIGGDGSQIELHALTPAQLESLDMPGELACSFSDADLGTLLVARADVLPDGMVHGALSNNGYTEMIANGKAGGFNDLLDGIVLAGKGLTVRIEREAAQPTGDESTRHAATLTVQRADGAERTYDGTLTCGP